MRVANYTTKPEVIPYFVPQGLELGPSIFMIFINDVAKDLKSPCYMFAADVKLAGKGLERDLKVLEANETADNTRN
ncbi:unnamed protein product [Echinostoma caproni]|uniref:Reverse transcriptase domain-containing protein n=1 Tax=Echinostoma caproni TaxID=27848 RepID=A0A183B5C2_9TREM|nr:unnamed protein product [Echinostoma caproni]